MKFGPLDRQKLKYGKFQNFQKKVEEKINNFFMFSPVTSRVATLAILSPIYQFQIDISAIY